jgi:hypothetical protein
MKIKKNILAIFRILEALPERGGNRYDEALQRINKVLTPQDKKTIADILKAMLLLTAGNQDAVRDPEKYDPAEAKDNFSSMTSPKSYFLFRDLELPFELMDPPTKEDYQLAKKLLPIMGSSFVSRDDIDAEVGKTGDLDRRFASEGYDIVYRGLNRVSTNVIGFLMSSPTWDIGRGVSTSYEIGEAKRFSKSRSTPWGSSVGPAILFTIRNLSKRGFHAGSLSRYSREKEIILSGELRIDTWLIEAIGDLRPEYGDPQRIKIQIYSGDKTVIFLKDSQSDNSVIHRMNFPTEEGESFDRFSQSLIKNLGGLVIIDDEEAEISVDRLSILIKANATLP